MQIEIPNHFSRAAGWLVCFAGLALGCVLAIGVLSTGGQWWVAPVSLAVCTLAGGIWSVGLLVHSPKVTVSPEGVLAKRFFRTRFYSWKDFIQVGVTWTHLNRRFYTNQLYDHEIVLLLPGGSRRKKYDTLFFLRNIRYILYLPYREDVLVQVLQGYGKLDFCFLNGSYQEEYYTIEEETE